MSIRVGNYFTLRSTAIVQRILRAKQNFRWMLTREDDPHATVDLHKGKNLI